MREHALKYFCLVFLAVVAVLSFRTSLEDYDIWFHLKYGEHYVRNLTWHIDHSVYSWTPTVPDWKYVTWLGSSVLYLAYLAGAFPGLAALQWSIFIALFALYCSYIKSSGDALDVTHITALLLAAIAFSVILPYIKPEMFTALFFAITVFVYFRAKSSGKNLFYAYPVLLLLWVNTHGGFLFGLFFISAVLILELANTLFIRKSSLSGKLVRSLALSVFLSYIAVLVNPYGIHYHLKLLQDLFFSSYMEHSSKILAYQGIWQFFFPKAFNYVFMYGALSLFVMAVSLAALALHAYARYRFFDPVVLLLNLLFFLLIIKYPRSIFFFPIVWLFSVAFYLSKTDSGRIRKKLLPVALAVFLIFGGGFLYDTYSFMAYKSFFGSGIDDWVPEKEVAFIKEKKLPGPIFNDYLVGGYMIWALYPEYKVFIDPRYGPYVHQVLGDWFGLHNNLTPEHLAKFTGKYRFNTVLMHLREPNIIRWLLGSGQWKLIYFDKSAAVLVRLSVFETLDNETRSTDLGPARFRDVSSPTILTRVFDTYAGMGRLDDMQEIYETYVRNVSDANHTKEWSVEMMKLNLEFARKRAPQAR
ncbi:MAG: hypothetical protein FD164_1830 [Nitrospirae bacterium]|nr:MAG: hypothetical protein FD164_1830 [Nitrospirota bacterium]